MRTLRGGRSLLGKLGRVRALVLDVDGVLTDGGLYYGERGEALKKFHVRDGMGLRLVQEAGVAVALVTGEETEIVRRRAEKLKIRDVYGGVEDKRRALEDFLASRGIAPGDAATQSGVSSAVVGTVVGAALGAAIGAATGNPALGAGVGAGAGLFGGTMVGASAAYASGTAVQYRYDIAYQQCMYAKGNQIPAIVQAPRAAGGAYGAPPRPAPLPPPPPNYSPPPPAPPPPAPPL